MTALFPEKKTKRKRTAKRREEYSSYIIEITNSEMSYSFSLNKNKNWILVRTMNMHCWNVLAKHYTQRKSPAG